MDINAFTWLRLAALSGREGARWAAEFENVRPLVQESIASVARLRRGGGHTQSAESLRSVRGSLDAMETHVESSLLSAADRWYYGALGFHFYTQRAFGEADDSMRRAHEAVSRTIEARPCLIGFAHHCHDFEFQRARIARDQCRWEKMREHAEASAAMLAGYRPLCTLSNGTPITLVDVRNFYASLSPDTEADRATLAMLLEDQGTIPVAGFVRQMFRLSGFVIEYA